MTDRSQQSSDPDERAHGYTARLISRMAHNLGKDNPLLTREVLTTMRLRSIKANLVTVPLLLAFLVLVLTADTHESIGTAAQRGATLLGLALTAALYVVGLVGAVLGAQSIASERQAKTLDLVLATGMSPWRIVMGKALAVWVVLATLILACLPPLGAVFLVGGVSLTQLLLSVGIPLVVAAVPVALGVALGTVQRSARLAVGAAVTTVGLIGPMVFSAAWFAVLATIGVERLNSQGPFALPTGSEGFWPLLIGGILVPLYLVVAPTWFFLAASVGALMSEATDRARPLRHWFAVIGPVGGVLVGAIFLGQGLDNHEIAVLLISLLGVVLTLGALVISAHPAPRRMLQSSTGLPIAGPNGDALFVTIVSALSLAPAIAMMTPAAGIETVIAGVVVLAFIVLISGSGVMLASLLRPRLARWGLLALTALIVSLPLILWLFLEVLSINSRSGDTMAANVLSPVGALLLLVAPRTSFDPAAPLVSVVAWTLLGATAWQIGASRLRRKPPSSTQG